MFRFSVSCDFIDQSLVLCGLHMTHVDNCSLILSLALPQFPKLDMIILPWLFLALLPDTQAIKKG